ncbi:neprilysin-1-like [Nasonia vitripennis]|uniref:Peptidase M13 N-terminal domain-containing protein n=1 Tax=Nasonia vitripennis TaxID=7425 RepID=A0A7M7HE42_NASVI|nr:neprilysin-1-like [Nasonia vitripennis]
MSINGLFAVFIVIYVVSGFAVPIEDSLNNIDAVWISNGIHTQNKQNNDLLSVLSGLDQAVDPCEDAYSYACKNGGKFWTQEYVQKIYPEVRNSLIKILSQKPTKKEVHSLSIEKQLFQQCMNLGANETSEAKDEKEVLIARLFQHVFRPNANWKNIDEALNIIGFGHPFFDINVERDPENPSHNIVSLRPPSHAQIKHIKHLTNKAFETSEQSNLITNIVDSISTESKNTILNFLSILHPLVFFTTTQTGDAEKIKLNNLNSIGSYDEFAINLRQKIESDPVSDHFPEFKDFLKSQESNDESNNSVDLIGTVKQHFAEITNINDNEVILVKHTSYFVLLNKLLNAFSNHAIAEVIKFKVLIENLRYIEWKSANSLEHIKRSIFCFGDTKLYGASFKLNRDLRKDTHKEGQYYELVQDMLHEIVDVINTEISNSKIISSAEKAYFVSEMKLITANALHQNREYVSEYYRYNGQDFEFGSSYFSNIIRYRKLLQRIEMSKLKDTSKNPRPEPYSITDLDRPSNRFVFSLFVNSHYSPLSPELPKEIHYSVYGVKIASFLFGLFNEQKRVDALQARHRDDWSAHPTYSKAAIDCFTSSLEPYDKELPKETLTELFGLRIAYKAMLNDYLNEGSRKYFVPELAREGVTADKMFFVSYARYHCYYGKRVMNTILSNVDAFSFANNCYEKTANDLPKCHLKGFEIQENNLLSRA